MERLIPYDKMSKKEKKAYNEKRRVVWQFSPVTRKKESAKAYSRQNGRRETRRRGEEGPVSPCFFAFYYAFFGSGGSLFPLLRFFHPSPPRPESCTYSSTVPSVTFTYTI